jgi:four helix bundle protein
VTNAEGSESIRDYRDLVAWQEARLLVKDVYVVTRVFPREELFGLTQQLRRAAVSVPSNIAEGYGRGSRSDYIRFLRISRGSLYEVQCQLLLAEDLGYVRPADIAGAHERVNRCARLLHGLLRSLTNNAQE